MRPIDASSAPLCDTAGTTGHEQRLLRSLTLDRDGSPPSHREQEDRMMETWEAPLRLWCAVESRLRADADQRGQGTVEYVGLVVAVALLLTAVSTQLRGGGGIDDKIVAIVKGAVEKVGKL